jgi:hypothetical protein
MTSRFASLAGRLLCAGLVALAAGCSTVTTLSEKTQVELQWRDPKFTAPPMRTLFVVSLMKVEPGGRDAVEDAIVTRLATAGVKGIASHTMMSSDADKPGPTLEEAIKASGAEGVLIVEVRAVGVFEPYTVGRTMTSLAPDTAASYDFLKREYKKDESGDYKVARISSQVYTPTLGKEVWIAFTHSYDANNLAQNLPDFTLKLVGALAKDAMIPGAPRPAS